MRNGINVALGLLLLCAPMAVQAVDNEPGDRVKPEKREIEAAPRKSMLEVLKADGRFKILLTAIKDTDLEATLSGGSAYTFFAPMDEAFERVPKLAGLLENREKLKHVLNHHLFLDRALDTEALWKELVLLPKEGKELKVKYNEKNIEINDAKILVPNLRAKEGISHGIDHVLMDENDSFLRSAGGTVERNLKKGADKIKETFHGSDNTEKK